MMCARVIVNIIIVVVVVVIFWQCNQISALRAASDPLGDPGEAVLRVGSHDPRRRQVDCLCEWHRGVGCHQTFRVLSNLIQFLHEVWQTEITYDDALE